MATTYGVDLVIKSKGQGELQKFAQGAGKVDAAVKKAQGSLDDLTGKFSKSGIAIRKSAGGLEYFIDKLGRARKANGQFVTSAEAAANSIAKTGRASQAAAGKVKVLTQSFSLLKAGIAGLGIGLFIKGMFSAAASIEQTKLQLKTLVGSAEEAERVYSDLQEINKQSPFQIKDLTTAATRLSAYGVTTENLTKTTRQLGLVAAGTGQDIQGIATAYGQVVAKGRLQGEELMQFMERGVDVSGELQRMLGLTKEEFADMTSKGQISAELVQIAIANMTGETGRFNKAFENTADSLNTTLSNMQDAFFNTAGALGKAFEPIFKYLIDEATKFLNMFTNVLGNWQKESSLGNTRVQELKMKAAKAAADKYGPFTLSKEKDAFRTSAFRNYVDAEVASRNKPSVASQVKAGAAPAPGTYSPTQIEEWKKLLGGGTGTGRGTGTGTRQAAASAPRPTFISIEDLGRALQGKGYTVKEHPSFGGVSGGHAPNSYHKYGEALDVTDHRSGDWMGRTKQLENQLRGSGAGFAELLGPASGAAGHETHIHIAAASGKVQLTPELAAVLGLPGAGERGASALQVMNQQAEEMMRNLAQGRQTIEGIVSNMQGGTQGFQDMYDDSQLRDRLELEGMSAEQIGIQLQRSQQLRDVERNRVEALAKVTELAKEGLIPVDEIKDAQEKITAEYEKQAGLINTLAQGEMKRAEASGKGKIQSKIEEYQTQLADTEGMIVSLAGTVESEIGSAMSSAITSLIDGTGSAQEAFSNMFKNIGQAFIQMATQMIAKALIMKALGILFGGGSTPAIPGLNESGGGLPLGELSGSMPWSSWAGGGYTGDGSRSGGVDGQGGFPAILHPQETVVDHSSAMSRWSAGNSAGGGAGGGEGAGGAGGGADPIINISTGPTMQFEGSNYVSQSDFQAGLAQAAKQGAKQGETMALRKLQMSPGTRRKLGI